MNEVPLQAALQFLKSWLMYRAANVDIPGFTVAISHNGDKIFSEAYGLADIERRETLTTKHIFGVASQSKMFTATTVLQLAEQGKLTLSDRISTHLPWLDGHRDSRATRIMIWHLLSHRSGLIRDGTHTNFWELARPFPDAKQLKAMTLSRDLVFYPGTKLKYSNLGYALLGQIIEAASGQTFESLVSDHIIKPLRLEDTFAEYSPRLELKLSTAYGPLKRHRRAKLVPRLPTRAFAPAVGIHATAEDMCRFMSALTDSNERLLSNPHKHEARSTQAKQTDGYDAGTEFGYGFEIHHVGNRRLVGHDGHLAGFSTATLLDPEDKLAVSVMANCRDAPSTQIAYGIFEILDWFIEHANAQTPKNISRFNSRLSNTTTNIDVIAAANGIIAFDPDDWQPLADAEELSAVNSETLHVTTPGSAFNGGEQMKYQFNGDVVDAVRYAGFTMTPETPTVYQENLLNFSDLEHISLHVGKVQSAEPMGASGVLRLTVDFGPDVGMKQALFQPETSDLHYEALPGQMVLGGVFPF
jgi:CubicO group peptidase (beta-lactamase class C family)